MCPVCIASLSLLFAGGASLTGIALLGGRRRPARAKAESGGKPGISVENRQ
ncbi:hypothetical protein I5K76_25205 [Pseudomonas aeruginosa]|nr:hypothetical protein [Pseudomonas aeruginosa]